LSVLAIDIMTWVGIPATAGTGLWPYGAWTERRAEITGDAGTERDVEREVEIELTAMRRNPAWYEKYILRPIGRKQAPLSADSDADDTVERSYLALTPRQEADDIALADLAAVAIEAMASRMARGEDVQAVVVDVIRTLFGSGTGADRMDRPPGTDADVDEQVCERLDDPESVDRIVDVVLDIVRRPEA
jgi:hypothetical protein